MAVKEGTVYVPREDDNVLLEFSMNSEEEVEEADEVEQKVVPNEEEAAAERQRRIEQEEREAALAEQERQRRADMQALGQIGRSWEVCFLYKENGTRVSHPTGGR